MARRIVLRVNTFGLPATARYALPDRRHQGGPPLNERSPIEIYRALRGATIAGAHAADHKDLMVALCRVQELGAELAARLVGKAAVIERDPVDSFDPVGGDDVTIDPLGTSGRGGRSK